MQIYFLLLYQDRENLNEYVNEVEKSYKGNSSQFKTFKISTKDKLSNITSIPLESPYIDA